MLRTLVVFALLAFTAARAQNAPNDGLAPGGILDAASAAAADGLLPAEVVAHYKAGHYKNTIGAWPKGPMWDDAFQAATAKNVDRFGVNDRGHDRREGHRHAGDRLRAAVQDRPAGPEGRGEGHVNAYYALWRVGGTHDVLAMVWVGPKTKQREAVLDTHLLFYEGVPPSRAPKRNDLNLAQQTHAIVTSPADLNGTASLAWRFRDPAKQDQAWTYVPALRRVRQISPANRSDGVLGSDLSQDDGAIFDGKPEDFEWKWVGERTQLVLTDPTSLAGNVKRTKRPDGGYDEDWPTDQKVVGYQDPQWTGLAWAPLAPVLVQRKVWVVEAKSRDPYYLFDRIELAFDQETFQGVSSRKFDAQGTLLRSLRSDRRAGVDRLEANGSSARVVDGLRPGREREAGAATVAGTVPPGKSVHARRRSTRPVRARAPRRREMSVRRAGGSGPDRRGAGRPVACPCARRGRRGSRDRRPRACR
jgi:hypothetical protein